jgi:hypothetical protein
MTIGASDVNAFVGVGGPYFVDSNDDGIIDADDTPLESMAPWASCCATSTLRWRSSSPPIRQPTSSSYYAVKASGGAEVIGIDGITIRADVLGIEINGGKNHLGVAAGAGPRKQPESFLANGGLVVQTGSDPDGAGDLPAPSLKLDFTGNVLRAFGAVTIIIDNFVYVSGNFEFVKSDHAADGRAHRRHQQDGQRAYRGREQRQCLHRHRQPGQQRRRPVRPERQPGRQRRHRPGHNRPRFRTGAVQAHSRCRQVQLLRAAGEREPGIGGIWWACRA